MIAEAGRGKELVFHDRLRTARAKTERGELTDSGHKVDPTEPWMPD